MIMNFLITGGYGFIGINFCYLLNSLNHNHNIFILDKLTSVSSPKALSNIEHTFFSGDIGNYELVTKILIDNKIDIIVNFAAETHVDNSINNPDIFIHTNIIGTFSLLKATLFYQQNYNKNLKFIHISTDEVFGDLKREDPKFNELTRYNPSSPYSASKAASDHLVMSFVKTFNLNAIVTNCTNNYGLYQNVEKFIPKTIFSCIKKMPIIIYGDGSNIRDWIWVKDHCLGIYRAIENFKKGISYCFGGDCEMSNINVANLICKIFTEKYKFDYFSLISFVSDRKGHDFRYAVDSSKAKNELGFENYNGLYFEDNIKTLIDNMIILYGS